MKFNFVENFSARGRLTSHKNILAADFVVAKDDESRNGNYLNVALWSFAVKLRDAVVTIHYSPPALINNSLCSREICQHSKESLPSALKFKFMLIH